MCHAFPADVPLTEGNIVTIDTVVNLNGGLSDSAWTYRVGNVSEEAERLMVVAENALYKGIDQAVIGNHVGDIGYAIESYVANEGFLSQETLQDMESVKRFMKNQQFFILGNEDKDLSCKKEW